MFVQNKYDTVSISRQVARDCGLPAAHVFAYLSNWINFNAQRDQNVREGRVWTYCTTEVICEGVEFFSLRTIKDAIIKLESAGYILRGSFNKSNIDRTTWYALGTKATDDKIVKYPKVQKLHDAKCNDCTMQGAKIARPIPNSNTRNIKTKKDSFVATPLPPIGGGGGCDKPEVSEFTKWLGKTAKKYGVCSEAVDRCKAKFMFLEGHEWTSSNKPIRDWRNYFETVLLNQDLEYA